MTLSTQEFQKLQSRLNSQASAPQAPSSPGGLIGDIKNSFNERSGNFNDVMSSDQNPASKAIQAVGQGAGLISDTGANILKSVTPNVLKNAISSGARTISDTAPVKSAIDKFGEWAAAHPEAAKNLSAAVDIASLIPTAKAAEIGATGLVKGAKAGTEIASEGASKALKAGKNAIDPAMTPQAAAGQILQGTTKDVAKGLETIKNIDTSGIRTFGDFKKAINSKVSDLSKVVDENLAQDTSKILLKDLGTTVKSSAGREVTDNAVERSLNHLKELYTSTGDVKKAADIEDLINTASNEGLTRLEVNNIAKEYGREFGQKAFNAKTGDALTSVNAQLFENTRKGLKDVARSGINGAAAKEADRVMSSLLDTDRLVTKNIEAVNKLKQKVSERGLLEKTGHAISKYADILSGGTIRGLVSGLLPRGAGYKVMNALDVEERLSKNLKVINKAIETGQEKDILKALESIKGSK